MSEENFEFAGYSFKNEDELELAKKEATGIKHIKQRINYDDADSLLSIYNKLIERDLFKTVVGIDFLKSLRKVLLEQYDVSPRDLKSVPVPMDSVDPEDKLLNEEVKKAVNKKAKKVKKERFAKSEKPEKSAIAKRVEATEEIVYEKSFKKPFVISVIICVVLAAVLLLSIRILTDSENINIVNYQERLERQYQSWENDLTERERALNEKTLLK